MPEWVQHLLVLTLAGLCLAWVGWQGVLALAGRRSKVGSCCSKGCAPREPSAGAAKVQFLPVDVLRRRK